VFEILTRFVREISEILQIKSRPVFSDFNRLEVSMPQYKVGHLKLVDEIFEHVKKIHGLYFTGNSYRGVGIPDCIQAATQTASSIINELSTSGRPKPHMNEGVLN